MLVVAGRGALIDALCNCQWQTACGKIERPYFNRKIANLPGDSEERLRAKGEPLPLREGEPFGPLRNDSDQAARLFRSAELQMKSGCGKDLPPHLSTTILASYRDLSLRQ
jgi:hypothetical protein